MADNHKRLVNRDKERNQFLRLRYKEDCTIFDMPDISARDLAKKIGISTGLISKLESEDIIDMDAPPCNAAVLKCYHDEFKCSYEYLMGETELKTPKYYNMGKDPILKLFDDSFYDKLKELLANDEYQHFNVYMLRAFINSPKWLQSFMETTFYHLYEINKINSDSTIRKADKDVQTASLWFSLNTKIKTYFENVLLSELEYGFRQHEENRTKLQEQMKEQMKQKTEQQAADREQFDKSIQTADLDQCLATTDEYEEYMQSLQKHGTTRVQSFYVHEKDSQY